MCSFAETTHTPQGDGNLVFTSLRPPSRETTHTPQGDGNQKTNARSFAITRNNPHPARGRKRQRAAHCDPHVETTHTPQGDGNTGNRFAGGKSEKQPTPRKGTETPWPGTSACPPRNNPHPARGRKTICVYIAEIVGETIRIPDRGQLTKKERETH